MFYNTHFSYTPARTLIIGTTPFARELANVIENLRRSPYSLIGVICESGTVPFQDFPCAVVCSLEDLVRVVTELKPQRIIVALSERRGCLPVEKLLEARVMRNIVVENADQVYERLTGKLAINLLTPSSVIFSDDFRPSVATQAMMRAASLLVAVVGLIALAPLFVLISVAIKCDSAGPVFFKQDRIGKRGVRFNMLKFRSMCAVVEKRSEWARDNGDRITRVGKWLRRYRLDELPQFINILRGDMNLVGPRPHPFSNHSLFTLVSRNIPECGGQIPYYPLRLMVRPGITGWAQTRYQYANDLEEEMEKMCYDLYYIKHYSIWLDMRILLETIKIVLTGSEQPKNIPANAPSLNTEKTRFLRAGEDHL